MIDFNLIEKQLNNQSKMGLISVNDAMRVIKNNVKPTTIEQIINRVAELNNNSSLPFERSLENIAGQRAGYLQCLKDLGLLKKPIVKSK